MSIKIFSFDLETGGVSPSKNGIHQFAARVYIDYKCVKEVKVDVQFSENQEWSVEALNVSGKTIEQVMASPFTQKQLYAALKKLLTQYCDQFNKQDKFHILGYNSHAFDIPFLRALFEAHGDTYFNSFFWSDSLDMMLCAAMHLRSKRHLMKNFKLVTVAQEYGFAVDESKAHDALYDLTMHEHIFQKLTSIQLQPYEAPAVQA